MDAVHCVATRKLSMTPMHNTTTSLVLGEMPRDSRMPAIVVSHLAERHMLNLTW